MIKLQGQRQKRFQPDDPEFRLRERKAFRILVVRRMIARDDVDCSVCEAFNDRATVDFIT